MIELFVLAVVCRDALEQIELIASNPEHSDKTKLKAIEIIAKGTLKAFEAKPPPEPKRLTA